VRRFIVQENGLDRCWISLVQPRDVGGFTTYLNLLIPAADKHLLPAAVAFGEAQAADMGLAQLKLETTGVVIQTVADLGGESFLRRLLPVAHATVADIPKSVEYVPWPYEQWVVWMQPPYMLPDRIWVAVLDGEPIGYSYLAYRPSLVETGFPGVVREHRGKGLARALKLETLFQALDLGVTVVETDNDSENAPILHITRSSVTGRCLAGSSSTGS